MKIRNMILLLFVNIFLSCTGGNQTTDAVNAESAKTKVEHIIPAAERPDQYLKLLKGKKVGLVVNQSSRVKDTHLVDFLLSEKVNLVKLFAPEHGIRGKEDAGAKIEDGKDTKTGLTITSLYGKKKKPGTTDLEGIDVLVFDIQDVGVRFYTYISTLHYIMEAAAENNIHVIVLDRPNPNAHYVDGPVLEKEFSSFVGMHPVPVVYGLTIGEYGNMINGEKWLTNGISCDLTVIPCANYNHSMPYPLPIKPSPNLPNFNSVLLYPSLCFFEGTHVSVGRGTNTQFQVLGSPILKGKKNFSFTPVSMDGAKYPKHENISCYGDSFVMRGTERFTQKAALNINHLIEYHKLFQEQGEMFFLKNNFFNKLAGNASLQANIKAGKSEAEIRATWQEKLNAYKEIRKKYMLYDI